MKKIGALVLFVIILNIDVTAQDNAPPVAVAGGDVTTTSGKIIVIDAFQSYDIDNDIDGNALKILPTNARTNGTGCQTSATAGMTITNSGNITTNIDANFSGDLDANVWLKVWMGTDSGCGTNGLGGWQRLCTFHAANDATSAVDPSNCRDFNSSNETLGARLISDLTALDSNQLCFSGELAGSNITTQANVTQGDHNGTFQTSTDFS